MSLTPQQEADCLAYDPFGGGKGDDGLERTLSDRIVTARKAGQCCICFETIQPRERVRKQVAIVDGGIHSCRMCEACCSAMAKVWTDDTDINHRTAMGMVKAGALPPEAIATATAPGDVGERSNTEMPFDPNSSEGSRTTEGET